MNESKSRFFQLLDYKPYGRQQQFHDACDDPSLQFIAWFAGARGGKDRAGSKEIGYQLLTPNYPRMAPDPEDETKTITWTPPGKRIWIVGPNYKLGAKTFEYVYRDIVETLPKRIGPLNLIHKQFNEDRGAMHLELGPPFTDHWVTVVSAENPESLLGEEVDLMYLAEGSRLPKGVWDQFLNYRISSRRAKVLVPTTPAGFNWLHDEFFTKAGGPETIGYKSSGVSRRGTYWTQVSSADESPYYPKEEKERHKASDDPQNLDEQFHGRFVQRTGLVLYQLIEGRNVLPSHEAMQRFGWDDPFRPPLTWPRMVSMDYADAGWKGTLIWAIHPLRKYAVVYQEWKEKGREIEEQVREATKLLGPRAEAKTTQWVVDRSAPLLEYQKWRAPVVASKSNPGQKANLISTANGLLHQGRIFVLRENCPQFLYEAARFVRKPESDRPFADDRKPGSVVKKDDHLCDPFLYGCAELTLDLGSYEQPAALEEEKVPWPPPPPTRKDFKQPVLEQIDDFLDSLNQGL